MRIAHKTGTLHDTLNDVGIVYDDREPYAIAVMTTALPALDLGRRFIRGVSKLAYDAMQNVAAWREGNVAPEDRLTAPLAPDVQTWLGTPEETPVPAPTSDPVDTP
jgi:hypothetical protein